MLTGLKSRESHAKVADAVPVAFLRHLNSVVRRSRFVVHGRRVGETWRFRTGYIRRSAVFYFF